MSLGPTSQSRGWKRPRVAPTLSSHLAQGQQCGYSPEGELQDHEGGYPGPYHGQEQGQTSQMHHFQRGPLRSQPLLLGLPLGVTVGAEWVRTERQDHRVLSWEGCQGPSSTLSPF